MKKITKYAALTTASVLLLLGCQSEVDSDNSAPEIKTIHTYTDSLQTGTYENNESDMRLHIFMQVEDANGLDDLTHFYVTFPSGYESEIEITENNRKSRNGVDYLRVTYRMSNYGDADTRQIAMTGYSLKIKDSSNATSIQPFKVSAPDNEPVPDGAHLVHPNDYDTLSSGGDYVKALGLPTLHDASYDAATNETTVNIENSDSRATELQLYLYADGEYVGWLLDTDEARLATLDTPFDYKITEEAVTFIVDGIQLSDINEILYTVYDTGTSTGPFIGISFSGSRSKKLLF